MYDKVGNIDRWILSGTLNTASPLHIGDGEKLPFDQRDCAKTDLMKDLVKANPKYASVFLSAKGKPVIPGSSMKGALLAWAKAKKLDKILISEVFGEEGYGGLVMFEDAALAPDDSAVPWDNKARFWSATRRTVLATQVVIDPRTRSADEGLLYYTEYVPAGAVFQWRLTAQGVSDEQRQLLLFVLDHAFSSADRPATLGSDGASGSGRVKWMPTAVQVLGRQERPTWLKSGKHWTEGARTLTGAEKERWLAVPDTLRSTESGASVTLRLRLKFEGAMLINDPSRAKKADENGKNGVGHVMIRREDKSAYLPAHSIRGAFRAQLRRIWQTLAWERGGDINHLLEAQRVASRAGQQRTLGSFHRMVGAGGWRSPLEVTDFDLATPEKPPPHRQEFVAIDRFTGGAADQKKFQAEGLWQPIFIGSVTVQTARWDNAGVGEWGWLLLAFALRDWMEGDGTIGFGAAKGYGAFRALVEVEGEGEPAKLLRRILPREVAALEDPTLERWAESLKKEVA